MTPTDQPNPTPDLLPVHYPEPPIPAAVTSPEEEQEAAEAFAQFEAAIRRLEASRKGRTAPMRKVIDDYIGTEKSLKLPLEEERDRVAAMMEAYRLSPPVQGQLAEIRHLKKEFREEEKNGNLGALKVLSQRIAEADIGLSIPVSNGRIQYRHGIEILEVDESQLSERYFKRVLDEKQIKEDIELLGAVKGVEHRWKYEPSLVERKD